MKFQTKYKIEDYIGKKINYFAVVGQKECKDGSSATIWEFRCICGKSIFEAPARIISGHKKSCGCMRYKNIVRKECDRENMKKVDADSYIGEKRNKLTVIGYERPAEGGRTKLKCSCECGNTTLIFPYQFDSGSVKSCGCARFGHSDCHKGNESRKTHGLSKNKFYKKWNDMIRRCYNLNEPAYKFYGARGISVCDEWRNSPADFIKWCELTYPEGGNLSLDRIDGSKGYSPENCRWATQLEQVHNLKNNRFVTIEGETKCITEWCSDYKISPGTIYKRVHNGQSFEEAIATLIKLQTRK